MASTAFVRGVMEAITLLPRALLLFYVSKQLQRLWLQCLLLNGVLFVGSVLLFDHVWIPLWQRFILSLGVTYDPTTARHVLSLIYQVLWVYPVYALSFLLNAIWYQEMAERLHQLTSTAKRSKSKERQRSVPWTRLLVQKLSDEIYRNLLCLTYLLIMSLVSLIPYSTPLLYLHVSWVYAYYTFEYIWMEQQVPLLERLSRIEFYWQYMLGYGTPMTLLMWFLPRAWIAGGVMAFVFPIWMAMSALANPIRPTIRTTDSSLVKWFKQSKMPVFLPAKTLNHFIVSCFKTRLKTQS